MNGDKSLTPIIGRNITIGTPSVLIWSSLSAGGYFADIGVSHDGSFFCAVILAGTRENELMCYGDNTWGQVGAAFTGDFADSPVTTSLSRGAVINRLSVGINFACVLLSDGALGCWGGNNFGQLALPLATNFSRPVSYIVPQTPYTSISLGPNHVATCRADGTFWAWGRNDNFQVSSNATAAVVTPISDMSAISGNCSSTEANYHASYMITDRSQIRVKGYTLRPELAATLPGENEVSGGNITGSIILGVSARGGELYVVTKLTAPAPAALSTAGPASFLASAALSTSDPQVWTLPSSTESSNLVDLNQYRVLDRNPYVAKQLMEYIRKVTDGEYITMVSAGEGATVAVTNRGKVFSWVRNLSTPLAFNVALLPDLSTPTQADRLGLLGSFEILSIKTAKVREEDSQRFSLIRALRTNMPKVTTTSLIPNEPSVDPQTGILMLFAGSSDSFPSSSAFPFVQNPRPLTQTPIQYSRNDIFEASANFVVLASAPLNGVFATVWGGSNWTQISGVSGTITFVGISDDTAFVVVSSNQIWRCTLQKSSASSVSVPTATRIDEGVLTQEIRSLSVGPHGNSFAVTASGAVYSFGNNVALDGSYGLLCNPLLSSMNSSVPMLISGVAALSEVVVNGESVFGVAADRSTLFGCGRALYLGLAQPPANLSSFYSNFSMVPLPTNLSFRTIASLSCGYRHALAALSDGSIYSWGSNQYNETGSGSPTSVVSAPARLSDPQGVLLYRSVDAIAAGYDYSLLSSRASYLENISAFLTQPSSRIENFSCRCRPGPCRVYNNNNRVFILTRRYD